MEASIDQVRTDFTGYEGRYVALDWRTGEIVLADQDPQVVLREARDGLVVLGSVGFFDQFRVAIGGSARAVAVEYPDADRDAENPDAENPDASPSASALS